MRASQNIIDFIKTFEALRLEAYDDGGGVCVMKNGKARGANPPVHSGEAHPNATLSTEQLEQVKARYAQLRNYSAVGREFGVSHQTVRRIQNNLTRVNG